MKTLLKLQIFVLLLVPFLHAQVVNVNPDPDGDPWLVGGLRPLTSEDHQKLANMKKFEIPDIGLGKRAVLPSRVDHSTSKHFPSVFSQSDGSCGQASGVGYTFAYEINALRDASAGLPANQYPTHYTYNFLNDGSGANGSWYFDGWEIIRVNGCPNIIDYGGSLACLGDRGWLNGYTKYYNGMHNRVLEPVTISVGTPEGLETLKHYFNSRPEGSPVGGVVNFAAGATGYDMKSLPSRTHEAGMRVITAWGAEVNHAMTFSGYDDSIRYDWNGDGQYTNHLDITGDGIVDLRDWEIGGVIVVNSWGTHWGDGGKTYMMYRLLAESSPNGGIYNSVVHGVYAKTSYEPRLTMKASIKHTSREKLLITAGISQNLDSEVPEVTMDLPLFNRQGGDLSMLGGDSALSEVLEFGLDISPLMNHVPAGARGKIFLVVDEIDPSNEDNGEILTFSIIDHGGSGESSLLDAATAINNNGRTYLSLLIPMNYDPVQIISSTLPPGVPGEAYSQQLQASGGEEPYYWSIQLDYEELENNDPFPDIHTEQLTPSNNDDGYALKTLDFDFPFYGETYRDLVILTDGSILFEGGFQFLRSVAALRAMKAISVYASDLMIYPADNDGMWYEGNSESATFHWRTSKWNQQDVYVDVAVTLTPTGSIEFFYGSGISLGTDWVSGVSLGDEENFTLTASSSMYNIPDDYALLLTPPEHPYGMSVSKAGLFKGVVPNVSGSWNVNLKVVDNIGITAYGKVPFSVTALDAEETVLASGFRLMQNYPNPFNASTTIDFSIPDQSLVSLEVFNIRGQKVKTLVQNDLAAGSHAISWNGTNEAGASVASGVYYYRLSIPGEEQTAKMLLIK